MYGYDQLNRLIEFARGDLNNPKSAIENPKSAEDWSLDMTGNWPGYVKRTSGSTDLDQARMHNPVNEITAITATAGTDWADPVHDRNGNMTTIPKPASLANGLTATYDAWNRLVEVKDGQTVIARYDYDGLDRRIKSHTDSGAPSNPTGVDTYLHYYYNTAWQILETRQSDTESAQPETLQPKHQYVWSQRYIDAAVLRDENTGTNGLCDDQRLYYLNDANFNVTALLDTNGDAVERYVYSPYGVVTIYDPTWTNTRSASSYDNVTLYTGRELDSETGLYYYRRRVYQAQLGRFISREAMSGEVSLYDYGTNNPVIQLDPTGRFSQNYGNGRREPLGKILPYYCVMPNPSIRCPLVRCWGHCTCLARPLTSGALADIVTRSQLLLRMVSAIETCCLSSCYEAVISGVWGVQPQRMTSCMDDRVGAASGPMSSVILEGSWTQFVNCSCT